MPLRTRNQFVIKAHSTDRTHALPLYVHVRECDLDYFHAQERGGINVIEELLGLLDGDSAFKAFLHELDNVRMVDDLIKNKSGTLFHLPTSTHLQVQWQVQGHSHSLVNILQRSQRRRDECFVKKTVHVANKRKETTETTEDYVGGMLRPLPARKAAVTIWMYPPHVKIPPTGDRIPANDTCITDFMQPDDA